MIRIEKTDAGNKDFIYLVSMLDADLAVKDGEQHGFYNQYNTISNLKYVLLAYDDKQPIACGAIKEYEPGVMEVKRMFTIPSLRGQGLATQVLTALENWAADLGYNKCVLETGKRQPDAIQLYQKNGYTIIPNYGQYAGVENSVCFEKKLR